MTMNELGKKSDACQAFETLPSVFPKASDELKNKAKSMFEKNCPKKESKAAPKKAAETKKK